MADMSADDFTLLQVYLLKLVGLIDRSRKQRLLHEQQMVVGFDTDNGIDNVFQVRPAGHAGPDADPIALAPMLVWCEAGDQRGLLIENPAAIEDRTGKLRLNASLAGKGSAISTISRWHTSTPSSVAGNR